MCTHTHTLTLTHRGGVCFLLSLEQAFKNFRASSPGKGRHDTAIWEMSHRRVPCCTLQALLMFALCTLFHQSRQILFKEVKVRGKQTKISKEIRMNLEEEEMFMYVDMDKSQEVTSGHAQGAKFDPTAITPIGHLQMSFLFGPQRSDKDCRD